MKNCIAFAALLALALPEVAPAQELPASLDLCLARYRAGQAHYLATIRWTGAPAAQHLVLGARDTSNVVWVQRSHDTITAQRSINRVQFTVSDVSAYPLAIAVYDLSDAAYREYQEACRLNQECYFGPDDPGVTRLSPQVTAELARTMAESRRCPED